MTRRKKLLFVTDVFPVPLDRGQHVRVHNVLRACADGFDVTFVGHAPPDDVRRDPVEGLCERVVYTGPLAEDGVDRALTAQTLLSAPGLPRPAKLRQLKPFVAALRKARPETFDLVWAERPHVAHLCARFHERTVLDLDDLEHVKILRHIRHQRAPLDRAKSVYRYLLYRWYEGPWASKFRAAVICSDEDRKLLERRGCRNALVVPNAPASIGEANGASVRPARRSRGPVRVAFLGNVTHEPNVDAIEFFATDILPRLRAHDPATTFDVIGPNASPEVRARYESRVHFRGFAQDLAATLAEYDVLLAPLRFGGGTKLKVLDAMAHRIPIVTTAVGAEGLNIVNEQHALLAESAEALADCVLRIKRDEGLAVRLVENAYAHVRANFSWDRIRARLTEELVKLAETSPTHAR